MLKIWSFILTFILSLQLQMFFKTCLFYTNALFISHLWVECQDYPHYFTILSIAQNRYYYIMKCYFYCTTSRRTLLDAHWSTITAQSYFVGFPHVSGSVIFHPTSEVSPIKVFRLWNTHIKLTFGHFKILFGCCLFSQISLSSHV